jgi:hypothetical protein
MSNFFLPKKDKINNSQRQQSVQKAMKYLRNKTIKASKTKIFQTSPTRKNQLLARSILASSKTSRIRRKPVVLTDESLSNSEITTTTPTIPRHSTNKISPVTPSRSNEESTKKKLSITKRKHSISPGPHTPVTIKKRTKTDSSIKKTHSKRKESKTEEDESESEEDKEKQRKSTVAKRKLNLDLSSKLIILNKKKSTDNYFRIQNSTIISQ